MVRSLFTVSVRSLKFPAIQLVVAEVLHNQLGALGGDFPMVWYSVCVLYQKKPPSGRIIYRTRALCNIVAYAAGLMQKSVETAPKLFCTRLRARPCPHVLEVSTPPDEWQRDAAG